MELGVLTLAKQSQYITPIFIIPKKEGTARFITDYRRINQILVRNMYPLTRIGKTIQQLGGLQYATELYLNMGYYTIRVYPASQDMTDIVTEFGKFRYNRLPMGMCASGAIFQAKVDDIVGDIKGVKTYIYDLTVLIKY